jgi:hypothetical protein
LFDINKIILSYLYLCDNQGSIKLGKNPIFHQRTKQIEVNYHILRQSKMKAKSQLQYCETTNQLTDTYAKPLRKDKFEKFKEMIGMNEHNFPSRGSVGNVNGKSMHVGCNLKQLEMKQMQRWITVWHSRH